MNNQPKSPEFDTMKRDRFELLSAYLDGELTAAERRQVEEWLATDCLVQALYARLLKLRHGIQNLPVPASGQSREELAQQVLVRVNRRFKQAIAWGGAAAAAVFLGVASGFSPLGNSSTPQLAKHSQPSNPGLTAQKSTPPKVTSDALMIALDRPVVEIPKAAVSTPPQGLSPVSRDSVRNIR